MMNQFYSFISLFAQLFRHKELKNQEGFRETRKNIIFFCIIRIFLKHVSDKKSNFKYADISFLLELFEISKKVPWQNRTHSASTL